jgi:transcriptional regulator with XRE-family HTH domain
MVIEAIPIVDFFGKSRILYRMSEEELARVIGQNVRAARVHAELSQAELGALTGLAVPHVSRLEKGNHLPSVATLKKVADALNVPICSLLDPPPEGYEPKTSKKRRKK